MPKYAELLLTDGRVEKVYPKNGRTFAFDELYPLLGCEMIQVFHILPDENGSRVMLMDEDGRMNHQVENAQATEIFIGASLLTGYPIVGNVLICGMLGQHYVPHLEDKPAGAKE